MIRNIVRNSISARSKSIEVSTRSSSTEDSTRIDEDQNELLNENVVSNVTYVFLSNLSHSCSEFELFELFNRFGEITRIHIIHHQEQSVSRVNLHGFVGFTSRFSAEDAIKELQSFVLQGCQIILSLEKPSEINAEEYGLLPPPRVRTSQQNANAIAVAMQSEDIQVNKEEFTSGSSSGASSPSLDESGLSKPEEESKSIPQEEKEIITASRSHGKHSPLLDRMASISSAISMPRPSVTGIVEALSHSTSSASTPTVTPGSEPSSVKRRSFFNFGAKKGVEVTPPPKTVTPIKATPAAAATTSTTSGSVASSPDVKPSSVDSASIANTTPHTASATNVPTSATISHVDSSHDISMTPSLVSGAGSVADTNSVVDPAEVASVDGFEMEYEDEEDNKSVVGSEMGDIRGSVSSYSTGISPKRTSWFGGSSGGSHAATPPTRPEVKHPDTHVDPTLRVMDPILTTIGKTIRDLENACKKADDEEAREWKKTVKPHLESQIADLEKRCNKVKSRIETEINQGLQHIANLEEELRVLLEKQDDFKRRLYFPTSVYAIGQGGVYIGLDDIWLENVSGHINVELIGDKTKPQIDLLLNGTKNNPTEGFKLRLKVEGFKLAGDKGKNVPKINFDNLKVTIAVGVTVSLIFDVATQKWLCPSKNFKIEVMSFKGPYGINRSMVSLVLSLVSPMIRKELLNNLPHELGLLMRTFPSPFTASGEVDILGTDLTVLATELHKTSLVGDLCEYSPTQVSMFYWMQKSIDRATVLKTLSDIIIYRRNLSKNKWNADRYASILVFWQQAANIYSDKVVAAKMTKLGMTTITSAQVTAWSIKVETFFKVCDDLMRKRLCADIKLQYVDGQMSLNHILNFTHQLLFRLANESLNKATALQRVRLVSFLERLTQSHNAGKENLKIIAKNIDFAQLTIQANLHSGPSGIFKISLSDILAQAPVLLKLNITQEKSLGALPLVPYIISFKPQESGDVHLEIYHFSHDVAKVEVTAEGFTESGQNLVNSTGKFSNSYNKAMSSVSIFNTNAAIASIMRERTTSIASSVSSTSHRTVTSTTTSTVTHLLVKHDLMAEQLSHTLKNSPKGSTADSIVVIIATNPHISMIVDKTVTLKPGTEVFTLLIGPQKKGWKPFGTVNMFEEAEKEEKLAEELRKKGEEGFSSKSDGLGVNDNGEEEEEQEETPMTSPPKQAAPGCPVFMQTAPGIKMLTQIPKAVVGIDLAALMRFLLAHFGDLTELKLYLESFFGGEFFEEQLEVVEKILKTAAKYLLLPGLDMDINVNGKIVSLGNEIMVRIETPEEPEDYSSHRGDNGHRRKKYGEDGPCAIKLRAEVNLQDLLKDSMEIDSYVKNSTNGKEE